MKGRKAEFLADPSPGRKFDWERMVEAGIPPNDFDTWCTASQVTRAGLDPGYCRTKARRLLVFVAAFDGHPLALHRFGTPFQSGGVV